MLLRRSTFERERRLKEKVNQKAQSQKNSKTKSINILFFEFRPQKIKLTTSIQTYRLDKNKRNWVV